MDRLRPYSPNHEGQGPKIACKSFQACYIDRVSRINAEQSRSSILSRLLRPASCSRPTTKTMLNAKDLLEAGPAIGGGIISIVAAIVIKLIDSDRLILTDYFRWRRPLVNQRCVILINGGSGTGKTTIAWALARKFNIASVFGTDLLREGLRYAAEKSGAPKGDLIFLSSFETGDRFPEQCREFSGPLRKIIKRIRKKQRDPVIIEGVNIMASEIFSQFPQDARNGIYFVNLYINDRSLHSRRLRERAQTAGEDPDEADRYELNIDSVRAVSKMLKHDTDQYVASDGFDSFILSIENSGIPSKTVDAIEKRIKEFVRLNKIR